MLKQNLCLGKAGEEDAVRFLKNNGYKILMKNYRTKLGEVDIVARDKDAYCFIEVKARSFDRFGLPQESVSRRKQIQISKASLQFIKERNLFNKKARFDVVSVMYEQNTPRIDLIKNAFELDERFTC